MGPAGPLDVVEALRAERAQFVALLRSLSAEDWSLPTECPAYDVAGVAAHLLGDDFSLLSRQRDGATPQGLLRFLEGAPNFRAALDAFNDHWIETVRFFGPRLLVDLLEVTGPWTADWYAAVDPHSPGEPVGFFAATGPSPYWQIAAREYAERWIHHQILRALGRPAIGDPPLLTTALAVVVRGFTAHLRDLGAHDGDTVVLAVDGLGAWTLRRRDEAWVLLDGAAAQATAVVRIDAGVAGTALFRGMGADEVEAAHSVEGDADLGWRFVRGIAAMAAR